MASELNPKFKLVFISVLGLTVICLGVAVVLAYDPIPSDSKRNLTETCLTMFKFGLGALVGLLGGKAL